MGMRGERWSNRKIRLELNGIRCLEDLVLHDETEEVQALWIDDISPLLLILIYTRPLVMRSLSIPLVLISNLQKTGPMRFDWVAGPDIDAFGLRFSL